MQLYCSAANMSALFSIYQSSPQRISAHHALRMSVEDVFLYRLRMRVNEKISATRPSTAQDQAVALASERLRNTFLVFIQIPRQC